MPQFLIPAASTLLAAKMSGDAAKSASRTAARGQEEASQIAAEAEEKAFAREQKGLTSALDSFNKDAVTATEELTGLEDLFNDAESFLSKFLSAADDPSEDFGFSEAVRAGARDVNQTLAASGLFGSGANIQGQAENVAKQSGILATIRANARTQKLQAAQGLTDIAGRRAELGAQRSGQLLSSAVTRADLIGRGALPANKRGGFILDSFRARVVDKSKNRAIGTARASLGGHKGLKSRGLLGPGGFMGVRGLGGSK